MSSLPRSTQQVCHCSQEKLEKAYPEKKISDDCPECESAGKYVRISFHRSIVGGFTTLEKQTLKQLAKEKGVKKSPVSSFARRQEKFKKKLLFRQNADKNLPPNSCDICGQPAANLVAAHIIPYAYRAGIYLEECVHRHEVGASVHSPTDIHNGLLLCPSCDKGFESHDIDITPDGDIRISKEFLKNEGAKYKKLNGTKVRWADEMKDPACPYPSSAVLKYRGTLPIPSSKEGKQLIKKFNAEAREIGYNDEDFDEGGEEEEKEEEEEDEEDEDEEDRKKKKQKTGKNAVRNF